ncbi:hypothetical protein QQF64_028528 [Cirrhinus molitorella]|uniref:Uncharacterized protein n=1 Tax=Cirrhinus molitorella TaxID=172907 RepID=A0ABR3N6Y8_9TELE
MSHQPKQRRHAHSTVFDPLLEENPPYRLIHGLAIKSARDGLQSCYSQRNSLASRRLAPPEARPPRVRGCGAAGRGARRPLCGLRCRGSGRVFSAC